MIKHVKIQTKLILSLILMLMIILSVQADISKSDKLKTVYLAPTVEYETTYTFKPEGTSYSFDIDIYGVASSDIDSCDGDLFLDQIFAISSPLFKHEITNNQDVADEQKIDVDYKTQFASIFTDLQAGSEWSDPDSRFVENGKNYICAFGSAHEAFIDDGGTYRDGFSVTAFKLFRDKADIPAQNSLLKWAASNWYILTAFFIIGLIILIYSATNPIVL